MIRRLALLLLLLPVGACDDMRAQPKQKNYSPLVGPASTPKETVQFLERRTIAPPITQALLERGQQRYRIYCTPCHSELGDGNGMVVQRGFPRPPSYHEQRLREAPVDYFYDVITSGYGAMYSFAAGVAPEDRWAIAAYIRALQLSQNASAADFAAAEKGARP
jgi:mono/diheme cytochrome c family protein